MTAFLVFAGIGFAAQLVDGALGMGFGVISSSVLLTLGLPPALASASVNAAKLPTTATAASSHVYFRNIDWALVRGLAAFGALGGIAGALLLTSLKGPVLNAAVNLYLAFIGTLIIYRGFAATRVPGATALRARSIGLAGGLIEGMGGSWGPIVTTGLLGSGVTGRYAIGSGNFSEFIVSLAVFSTFAIAYVSGHWQGGGEWRDTLLPVAGLVAGGLPAAMIGGWLSKAAPRRPLTVAVGGLAVAIGCYRMVFV